MKRLLSLAGLSIVAIFGGASFTSGLLDSAQTRGHAIDGLKTAFGLPYGAGSSTTQIRFQVATNKGPSMTTPIIRPVVFTMTIAPPAPPQPPEVTATIINNELCPKTKPPCQSACF